MWAALGAWAARWSQCARSGLDALDLDAQQHAERTFTANMEALNFAIATLSARMDLIMTSYEDVYASLPDEAAAAIAAAAETAGESADALETLLDVDPVAQNRLQELQDAHAELQLRRERLSIAYQEWRVRLLAVREAGRAEQSRRLLCAQAEATDYLATITPDSDTMLALNQRQQQDSQLIQQRQNALRAAADDQKDTTAKAILALDATRATVGGGGVRPAQFSRMIARAQAARARRGVTVRASAPSKAPANLAAAAAAVAPAARVRAPPAAAARVAILA